MVGLKKGQTNSGSFKEGSIPWNKGLKGVTKVWNKGKKCPQISGSNHYNWKGGTSPFREKVRHLLENTQWHSDVFIRDNFTCQDCGQISGNLEAHHIKSFSSILQKYEITTLEEALKCEELWNINNGVTLCVKCHEKYHRKIRNPKDVIKVVS